MVLLQPGRRGRGKGVVRAERGEGRRSGGLVQRTGRGGEAPFAHRLTMQPCGLASGEGGKGSDRSSSVGARPGPINPHTRAPGTIPPLRGESVSAAGKQAGREAGPSSRGPWKKGGERERQGKGIKRESWRRRRRSGPRRAVVFASLGRRCNRLPGCLLGRAGEIGIELSVSGRSTGQCVRPGTEQRNGVGEVWVWVCVRVWIPVVAVVVVGADTALAGNGLAFRSRFQGVGAERASDGPIGSPQRADSVRPRMLGGRRHRRRRRRQKTTLVSVLGLRAAHGARPWFLRVMTPRP